MLVRTQAAVSCATVILPLLFVLGCGGGSEHVTAPVAGTVYLDGDPLPDAEITFATPKFSAVAKTNSQGRYEFAQGAAPGENKVVISKWTGPKVQLDEAGGMDQGQLQAMSAGNEGAPISDAPRELLPAQYSDPEDSLLTYTVPEGGTDGADFRLQSE